MYYEQKLEIKVMQTIRDVRQAYKLFVTLFCHLEKSLYCSISRLRKSLMFFFCEYLPFIELNTIENGWTSEQNTLTGGN